MMDEGSAGGEPDVDAIDLSSHSSGRRRCGAASHAEHFNALCLDMCPHIHIHIYTVFSQ